ncbi:MAG: hypothetical protein Q8O00_03475 [Holophaga sp.]|nr:hypothetical protein [Holophaga sp.]
MKIAELQKAKDWANLADYIEAMVPAQRGKYIISWMESLNRTNRWERLLAVCDASIPQMEAKTGPKLGLPRLLRAQALTQLQRHGEARLAHAENGQLGFPDGHENACAEARADSDWNALAMHAEALAVLKPGLGLSLQGEALCKLQKFSQAEPILEKAILLPGATAMAWADLACCLVERQAYPEAIGAATQGLVLEAKNMEALYNRGRAHFGLKQYKEGRADLAAALATGQADPTLARNIQNNIVLADQYLAHQEKKAQTPVRKPPRK